MKVKEVEIRQDRKFPTGRFKMEQVGVTLRASVPHETQEELLKQTNELYGFARQILDARIWLIKQEHRIDD